MICGAGTGASVQPTERMKKTGAQFNMMIPAQLKDYQVDKINTSYIRFVFSHRDQCKQQFFDSTVYQSQSKIVSCTSCVACGMKMIIVIWKKNEQKRA